MTTLALHAQSLAIHGLICMHRHAHDSGRRMMVGLTAEEILAHPGFARARLAHLSALVVLFRGQPFARRMMSDAGLIILRGFLVGFHFAFETGDRATWSTSGNIKRALVQRGLASPRRVDDMLAQFRQAGYVEAVPAQADRRVSLLTPTALVLAHDRAHLAAYHRFLLELIPERGYEWVLGEDEAAHRAFRIRSMSNLPQALSALDHAAIRLFLARDAGYLAFLLVAQAQLSDDRLTWSSLSSDLGVARSHLRTLFAEAAAAGYVRLNVGRGRPIEILPPLWEAYDQFLVGIMADQDAIAQAVFTDSKLATPAYAQN